MKHIHIIALLTPLWVAISGCKTQAPIRPAPYYEPQPVTTPESSLYIPVHISHAYLLQVVNEGIKGIDLNNPDKPVDGMTWTASINRPVALDINGLMIRTTIPLDVFLKKSLGFTSLKANGEWEVTLHTLFNIREDWTLQTHTSIASHKWLRKPVMEVAGISIPASALANWILDYSRTRITTTIDRQLQENFNLKQLLRPAWTAIATPFLISESMGFWFRFEPLAAGLEPFTSDRQGLHSAIHLKGKARISSGRKPGSTTVTEPPRFNQSGANRDSLRMIIRTEIPWPDAEKIAEDNLVGQVISSGKYKVKIEGIDLHGQQDAIIVSTWLNGDYKGQVFLRGRPAISPEGNRVVLEDFDFDIQTRNVLHRSAAWLFKGNLRNALQKALIFPLTDNLELVRKEIQHTLATTSPADWVRFYPGAFNLNLQALQLTPDGISMDFNLAGKIEVSLGTINPK